MPSLGAIGSFADKGTHKMRRYTHTQVWRVVTLMFATIIITSEWLSTSFQVDASYFSFGPIVKDLCYELLVAI